MSRKGSCSKALLASTMRDAFTLAVSYVEKGFAVIDEDEDTDTAALPRPVRVARALLRRRRDPATLVVAKFLSGCIRPAAVAAMAKTMVPVPGSCFPLRLNAGAVAADGAMLLHPAEAYIAVIRIADLTLLSTLPYPRTTQVFVAQNGDVCIAHKTMVTILAPDLATVKLELRLPRKEKRYALGVCASHGCVFVNFSQIIVAFRRDDGLELASCLGMWPYENLPQEPGHYVVDRVYYQGALDYSAVHGAVFALDTSNILRAFRVEPHFHHEQLRMPFRGISWRIHAFKISAAGELCAVNSYVTTDLFLMAPRAAHGVSIPLADHRVTTVYVALAASCMVLVMDNKIGVCRF